MIYFVLNFSYGSDDLVDIIRYTRVFREKFFFKFFNVKKYKITITVGFLFSEILR